MQKSPRVFQGILPLISIVIILLLSRYVVTVSSSLTEIPSDVPGAVWLFDDWKVEVSPTRGIILDVERQARVNSPQGRMVGRLKIWETFYQSLKHFHGAVTDTLGGILYTMEKDDLESGFPFSDYRLYSEDRLYEVDLTAPSFPYIVDYQYRLQIDNTFFWPDWILPDLFPRRSVSYTVAVPHLFTYRTREVHSGFSVDSNRTLKRDVTRWSAVNLVPDTLGRGAPYPVMYIAPEKFVVARQRGSTDSWANLGRWYAKLTSNRRKLTKEQAREVKTWPNDPADPRRIVSELKEIVSHNWRYVAIEIGIGGWRPHEAKSVFDSRYGDCKDLVFLWLAMLDQLALEAYPALVRTRDRQPLLPDFPKDWFDHVIGCAVIDSDTIWADLTAPGYPAGILPYQAEDRYALVITEDEGVLCRTPISLPSDNRLIRSLSGTLDEAGNLTFSLRASVAGHKLRLFGGGTSANNDNRKAAEILGVLPGRLTVDSLAFDPGEGGAVGFRVTGKIAEWAEFTSRRIIFPLAFAGWAAPQPMNDGANGRSAVQRPYPCHEIDSLVIVLPPGYAREFIPEDMQVAQDPVRFAFTAHFTGDTLVYTRDFQYSARRADPAVESPESSWKTISAIQDADAVFVRHGVGDTSTSTADDSTASEF